MFGHRYSGSARTTWRDGLQFRTVPALVAGLLVVALALLPATAHAHGDEGMVPARTSVLQAIAYLVNTPGHADAVADKLKDASDSEDTSGVDLADLQQAQTAFAHGDMATTRALLQRSIGAVPDTTGSDVRPILALPHGASSLHLAVGEESGTQVVTDELAGRAGLTKVDDTLLALAAGCLVLGFVLGRRFRPTHSIRALARHEHCAGAVPRGA